MITPAFAMSHSVQAEVPFEFLIGDKLLPPALYTFDIATDTGPSVLTIRTMMFDTVGDKTYLTEVCGVVDSGRAVKHLVDGHPLERAPEASRRHVSGVRIGDQNGKKIEK